MSSDRQITSCCQVVEAALDASTPGCSAALVRAVADLTLLARDRSGYGKVTVEHLEYLELVSR